MAQISMEQLKQIFESTQAQEAQKLIEKEFLFVDEPLFKKDGSFDEEHWVRVDEPITLAGTPWQAYILRLLPSIDAITPTLFFSAVRLVPPEEIKAGLKSAPETDAHKSASEALSKALASTDMAKLKLNLVRLFEEGLYTNDHYLLFPTPTLYALQPRFQYDVMMPFVSLRSLDPTIT